MHQLILTTTQKVHERQVYGLLDMMGDLGGVIEIIMILSQLALSGLSEHSFLLKAIEKLYLVKTEEDLFTPSQRQTRKMKKIQDPKHVREFSHAH